MYKKGQALDQLGPIVVLLIGIGIVLVVGFLIMSEAKDQILGIESSSWCTLDTASRNYTPWALNTAGGGATCFNSSQCNMSFVLNYTTGVCCNNTGSIAICNSVNWTDKATPYTDGTEPDNTSGAKLSHAWNGTGTTQDAMSDIPRWLPIIVITIIGTILIGLVAFFRRQ